MKTLKDLLEAEPVNGVSISLVEELVKSIRDNGWKGPAILYYKGKLSFGKVYLVTGSHRREAARILTREGLGHLKIKSIDVTAHIDSFCEKYDYSFDYLPFGRLFIIFRDSEDIELKKEISRNKEWWQ